MKKALMSAVLVLLVLAITGPLPALAETGKTEITKESLKTPEDIASYGMGLGMGKNSLKKLRITSYNVCYTKLLRNIPYSIRHVSDNIHF